MVCKTRFNRGGITLLEVMVAALLLVTVVFVAGKIILSGTVGLSKSVEAHRYRDELGVLAEYTKKYVVSGDIGFYGFTWNPALPLGRLIIPRSNSLAFVHYDKTTTPAITTICALPPTESQGSSLRIVIDTRNPTYGYPFFRLADESYFEVNSTGVTGAHTSSEDEVAQQPGGSGNSSGTSSGTTASETGVATIWATGKIPLGTASKPRAWALLAPPRASLWISRGIIKKISVASMQLPQECRDRLIDGSDGLYEVTLFPLALSPITQGDELGGSREPTADELGTIVGSFPKRVFQVSLRRLQASDPSAEPGISAIELGTDLSPTTSAPILQLKGALSLNISARYSLGMGPQGQGWFEYVQEGQEASNSCQNSSVMPCTKLPVPNLIPALALIGEQLETTENLNPNVFSLIKQENLSSLRFKVTRQGAAQTEIPEIFDAQFP